MGNTLKINKKKDKTWYDMKSKVTKLQWFTNETSLVINMVIEHYLMNLFRIRVAISFASNQLLQSLYTENVAALKRFCMQFQRFFFVKTLEFTKYDSCGVKVTEFNIELEHEGPLDFVSKEKIALLVNIMQEATKDERLTYKVDFSFSARIRKFIHKLDDLVLAYNRGMIDRDVGNRRGGKLIQQFKDLKIQDKLKELRTTLMNITETS